MRHKIVGRKNKTTVMLASCLFSIILTGCGIKSYDTNILQFSKDGSITEYMVEEFDESLYDATELKGELTAQIDEYNSSNEKDKVVLGDYELKDGVLKCSVTYPSDNAYFDLNNTPLFYGTIAQAVKAGYSLLTPVNSVETGELLESGALQKLDAHIVILNIPTDVNTYKNITYISKGVTVGDDHKMATVSGEGTAYIVFE